MRFYVGLHQPSDAGKVRRCIISAHRVSRRRSPVPSREFILDSGAFSAIRKHGDHLLTVEEYAEVARRAAAGGGCVAVVAQDYPCHAAALERTGLTVTEHQSRALERYRALAAALPEHYVMPVLQGWTPDDFRRHVSELGLSAGWVGVGSLVRGAGRQAEIYPILYAIKREAPALELHGFGLGLQTLRLNETAGLLSSADSMAWAMTAWREGRDANSVLEAVAYADRVVAEARPQPPLFYV